MDGCATGISGLVSQGLDWKSAKIAVFYSAKLNSAQQNYPVHEIEMLAGVETMLRYTDILQGVSFQWLTDHKGLTHLLNQKNLSGRQARWLEKISTFTFRVVYIEGSENVVADALSRLYSNDSPGTLRARSEFTYHDVVDDDTLKVEVVEDSDVSPVLAGIEARVVTRRGSRVRRLTEKAAAGRTESPAMEVAPRVKNRPIIRGSLEGGNRGTTTDTTTATNVPGTPTSNREVSNTLENDDQGQEHTETLPLLTQSNLGVDFLSELRGAYDKDPMFRVILEKPNEYRNFEVNDRLIYLKESERRVLCIP